MIEMEYNANKHKESVLLHSEEYKGYLFKVVNIRHDHPCVYIRLPKGNKFDGTEYDGIPLDVHGGLTYSRARDPLNPNNEGDDKTAFWWIGWDYAHLGDYCAYFENPIFGDHHDPYQRKYTTSELISDAKSAIDQLIKFCGLNMPIRKVNIDGNIKSIEFYPVNSNRKWYQAKGSYLCPCGGAGTLCITRKFIFYSKPYVNCGYCQSATELNSFKEVPKYDISAKESSK